MLYRLISEVKPSDTADVPPLYVWHGRFEAEVNNVVTTEPPQKSLHLNCHRHGHQSHCIGISAPLG